MAFSMPNFSWSTAIMGEIQLVVQDALLITADFSFFTPSPFTPSTYVGTPPLAGALTITFLAPAFRCSSASSFLVNRPVHSSTTSTLYFFHGKRLGSFSANTRIL